MNGQTSSFNEKLDFLPNDDETIKYGEKKKMSLTLPLLNVIEMNAPTDEDFIGAQTSENSKKKSIYEADDTFIQAIFSQTIKSTTATPTDDEHSQDFDTFKNPSKSNQDDVEGATSDMINSPVDNKPELLSEEPAAIYTYFHQTIEEDESPQIEPNIDINTLIVVTNDSTTCKPINITQTNIFMEEKEELSEKDVSIDNTLNNTSTAFVSNEAISESEHSLTQLNSLESDVSSYVCVFFLKLLTPKTHVIKL